MPPARRALIIFMRYPEAGKVKSRLASSIGTVEAASVYEKLVRRTLGVAREFLGGDPEARAFVFFSPGKRRREVEAKFHGPWELMTQEGSHLGERMGNADKALRSLGFQQVVLIGSDLPDLDPHDLRNAFEALNRSSSVLGPAADGGFYLIGLAEPCDAVFASATWGTGEVLDRTQELLVRCGLRVLRLRCRSDLDEARDLHLLEGQSLFDDRLSIVIPTIGFGPHMKRTLAFLQNQIWPGDEIILAQGGMGVGPGIEETPDMIRHVSSPRGRGLQLNAGATAARGTLLFFLHDDSLPPAGFAHAIRRTCMDQAVGLGCFELQFFPTTPSLNLVAGWANFRSRRLRLPYGDQGLFCRREFFERVGGFRRPYLMEDVDFVTRCRRLGEVRVLPMEIRTSSERYLRKGVLRASMQNHMLMLLYLLGVDDGKLYRIYYGLRRPG